MNANLQAKKQGKNKYSEPNWIEAISININLLAKNKARINAK